MHYLRKYGLRSWWTLVAAAFLTEPLWWSHEPVEQKIWIPIPGAIILVLVLVKPRWLGYQKPKANIRAVNHPADRGRLEGLQELQQQSQSTRTREAYDDLVRDRRSRRPDRGSKRRGRRE